MTQFPHDEFAKGLLEELLSPLGQVETSYEVTSEVRSVDVFFIPISTKPEYIARLGWLGNLASTAALFEPYRNPVSWHDIRKCQGKLIDVLNDGERKAKREGTKVNEQALPMLWILTPTASQEVLEAFACRVMEGEEALPGVYLFPRGNRTGMVVIHQLPEKSQTLWLRVLGRGRTQEKAMAELAALPVDDPLRVNSLELVYRLQEQLKARVQREQEQLDREDTELIMAVAPLFQEQLNAARLEGLERGLERGRLEGRLEGRSEGVEEGVEQGIHRGQQMILENLLRVKFGELDARMPVLIEGIAALSPEQFALFLLPLSQVGNDEAGREVLPRLFMEELLKFLWGDVEEGDDLESSIRSLLSLSLEALNEVLSLVKSGSKDEVLSTIAQHLQDEDSLITDD